MGKAVLLGWRQGRSAQKETDSALFKDAVDTLIKNHDEGQAQIKEWDIQHSDVKNFSFKKYKSSISVVAGGPPCQPLHLEVNTEPLMMKGTCFHRLFVQYEKQNQMFLSLRM